MSRPRAWFTGPGVKVIRPRPLKSPTIATALVPLTTGASACGTGGHEAVWPSLPNPRCTTSNRSGNDSAYRIAAIARSSPATGISRSSVGMNQSWPALRSSWPSGATRSSTCQTVNRSQSTSSCTSAANIDGAVEPPLTASDALPRRLMAPRSRTASDRATSPAGSSETRTDTDPYFTTWTRLATDTI